MLQRSFFFIFFSSNLYHNLSLRLVRHGHAIRGALNSLNDSD